MSAPEPLGEQLCFRALADPTRRQILSLLTKDDLTIADVATTAARATTVTVMTGTTAAIN